MACSLSLSHLWKSSGLALPPILKVQHNDLVEVERLAPRRGDSTPRSIICRLVESDLIFSRMQSQFGFARLHLVVGWG